MIFFLAYPLLALALAALTPPALTFVLVSTIPALRRYAITAPISAFITSPMVLLPIVIAAEYNTFTVDPPLGSLQFWTRFGAIYALLSVGCIFIAILTNLAVRAIFELLPPWLHRSFGLRSNLLQQVSIVVGGSLSLIVILAISALAAYFSRQNFWFPVLSGTFGLLCAGLCTRSILKIGNPALYQPAALPAWTGKIMKDRS